MQDMTYLIQALVHHYVRACEAFASLASNHHDTAVREHAATVVASAHNAQRVMTDGRDGNGPDGSLTTPAAFYRVAADTAAVLQYQQGILDDLGEDILKDHITDLKAWSAAVAYRNAIVNEHS